MASKKHRKRVRIIRAYGLRSNAVKLFCIRESRELYYKELDAININASVNEVMFFASMAYQNWLGRAYQNWMLWYMGMDRSLVFIYPYNGKIRAKNILVYRKFEKEIKENINI